MTLEEAAEKIESAIEQDGQYSHNICSCVLRAVAKEHGQEAANDLIRAHSLDAIYGIRPIEGRSA